MKIRAFRSHKVRPADYESLDFGASIEIDTETDDEYKDITTAAQAASLKEELGETLDELLATEVDRAVRLRGHMDESHLWDFYGLD